MPWACHCSFGCRDVITRNSGVVVIIAEDTGVAAMKAGVHSGPNSVLSELGLNRPPKNFLGDGSSSSSPTVKSIVQKLTKVTSRTIESHTEKLNCQENESGKPSPKTH